ncbi:hypothetical protein BDV96DRAFT_597978 [Lophiotrema nucula]|uniref:Uncharacterized protein n=1 Tax=Lophiotrema nucula TaxID=690887 RepID=A0A6A5ZC38_9PLEO|nr:hypothetical protein BDV96DRAFT_597978 [Lophiotrema nucula]
MRARLPYSTLRPIRTPALSTRRAFTAGPQLLLKEDADRDGHDVEQKKNEQLEKQEKGEGHWHEELASHGESNIAADKEKVNDHDSHMDKLQNETAKKGEDGKLE